MTDLNDLSAEQLDSIMRGLPLPEPAPPAEAPAEATTPDDAAAPQESATPTEEQPAAEPAQPAETEEDLAARYQALQAKFEESQRHGSRQSARADYFSRKYREALGGHAPAADDAPLADYEYVPDATDPDARSWEVEGLRGEVAEMRERDERREREALERRLADEYSRRVAGIDPAVLASVGAKYRGDLELVHQQTDPRDFETEMRGWLSRVAYESNEVALQQRTQAMQAKRSASTAARAAQVRDASVSASGSVPAPPPQPRTIADLSVEELDSWLKTNVPRH